MQIRMRAVLPGAHEAVAVPADADPTALLAGEPGAVYTSAATVGGHRVLGLSAHLERLLGSFAAPPVTAADLRRGLSAALADWGPQEARFLLELLTTPSALHPTARAFVVLWPTRELATALYTHGVRVVVAPQIARQNPGRKGSGWRKERVAGLVDAQAYEHLLLNPEGHLVEGFTSNLLAVLDGVLITPVEGALPGITQRLVVEAAQARGVPVRHRAIRRDELPRLSELGLCSSSRGVVPIVKVDAQTIGAGVPGPHLQTLHADWRALRANQAERVWPP